MKLMIHTALLIVATLLMGEILHQLVVVQEMVTLHTLLPLLL